MNDFLKGKLSGLEQAYKYCEHIDPENKNIQVAYVKLLLLREINNFEEYWDRQLKQETNMTIGKKLSLIEETLKYQMDQDIKQTFLEEEVSSTNIS